MNIQNLKQKKPAFYVVLFTLLIVVVCCILLLSSLSVPEFSGSVPAAAGNGVQAEGGSISTLIEKTIYLAGWYFTCT